MKLYQWQEKALARFKDAAYFALSVPCGCGKTLAAIKIALAKQLPVIVIAPGHQLCEQWAREIREQDPDASVFVYNRNEERTQGESYIERFQKWLRE